jgi:hypothetical protein
VLRNEIVKNNQSLNGILRQEPISGFSVSWLIFAMTG